MTFPHQDRKPLFTKEEEAALLAEYGTKEPFDHLLDVGAQSRFRSDYGDANVFLTGDRLDSDSDDGQKDAPEIAVGREDVSLPLESFLLKYTSAFTVDAPPSLTRTYETTLAEMQTRIDGEGTSAEELRKNADFRSVLQSSRLKEKQLRMLGTTTKPLREILLSQLVDLDADATSAEAILQESDQMLQRANALLATPTTSSALPRAEKDVTMKNDADVNYEGLDHYDRELVKDDIFDDESDDESISILAKARQYTKRFDQRRESQREQLPPPHDSAAAQPQDQSHEQRQLTSSLRVPPRRRSAATKNTALEEREKEKLRADLLQLVSHPPLVAFELVPPREETLVWAAAFEPPALVERTSQEVFALAPETEAVLRHIEEMPARDKAMEDTSTAVMKTHIKETRENVEEKEEKKKEQRAREGLINLDDFVLRINALIPPSDSEAHAAAAAVLAPPQQPTASVPPNAKNGAVSVAAAQTSVASSSSKSAHPEKSPAQVESVVAAIQRQSKRELFQLQQEARERQRMRTEDARMQAFYDALAERMEDLQRSMEACQESAFAGLARIQNEEDVVFQALLGAVERNHALVLQAERLREVKATAQLADHTFAEHRQIRESLGEEERCAYERLTRDFSNELEELKKTLRLRHAAKLRDDVARQQAHHAAFIQAISSPPPALEPVDVAALCSGGADRSGDTRRGQRPLGSSSQLHLEYEHFRRYCQQQMQKQTQALSSAVTELELNHRLKTSEIRKRVLLEKSGGGGGGERPTSSSSPPSLALSLRQRGLGSADQHQGSSHSAALVNSGTTATTGIVLSAQSMKELLSLTFSNAEKDPARVTQWFRCVSLALDGLTAIDYRDLSELKLFPSQALVSGGTSGGGAAADCAWMLRASTEGVCVCRVVRELDLGGNRLQNFSLENFLRVFPLVEHLRVCDGELAALEHEGDLTRKGSSLRSIAAALMNTTAENAFLSFLDISANRLTSLGEVGLMFAASLRRLVANTNRITSIEPLVTCRFLVFLELNNNSISLAEGLTALPLLQHVNLCNNKVQTFSPCFSRNAMLRNVYLSGNQISVLSDMGTHFSFVTHLFVNNNTLTALSDTTMMWMPLLSVFHAENNLIERIDGLRRCPRLCVLNLSFNKLASVEALAPLYSLTFLSTLGIAGNPVCPAGAGGTEQSSEALKEALRSGLPSLTELNSEAVVRGSPCGVDFPVARRLLVHPTRCHVLVKRQVAYNSHIVHCRVSGEEQTVSLKRELRAAEAVEEALRSKLHKAPPQEVGTMPPPFYQYSPQLQEEHDLRMSRCVVEQLEHLRHTNASADKDLFMNAFTRSDCYAREALLSRKTRAARRLAAWAHGLALIRDARAELAVLRAEYQRSEAYRREQAARKIQPVWRGAALRSRMKRIMKADDVDLGDDDEFAKVDLDFGEFENPTPDTLGTLFKKVLDAQGPLQNFEVPAAPLFASITPPARALSAPENGGHDTNTLRIGSSQSERPMTKPVSRSSAAPGTGTVPRRPAVADDWGSTVAAQIKKKNKKMALMHQQRVRSEYVANPLNAKKDPYGSGGNH